MSIQSIYNDLKHFMQETMARLQFRSTSFWEVNVKHFEDWLQEEKCFKDEGNTLIDSRPWKLRIIYGESHGQAQIFPQALMVF